MAILRADDIRNMDIEQMKEKLRELREELLIARTKLKIGGLENPGRIRELRRTIARILTIMREKEGKIS